MPCYRLFVKKDVDSCTWQVKLATEEPEHRLRVASRCYLTDGSFVWLWENGHMITQKYSSCSVYYAKGCINILKGALCRPTGVQLHHLPRLFPRRWHSLDRVVMWMRYPDCSASLQSLLQSGFSAPAGRHLERRHEGGGQRGIGEG